jgi:ribosome maturation factor RimP
MPPASADRSTGARSAGGSASAARERLVDLLQPVVAAAGYDLEDVAVTSAGRRSLVRVVVDSDHGVDLDAVAEVSRAVSDALDAGDAFAGPFVLEVSSPGVDRPLTDPRHWRRARGRLVSVRVGDATVTGRVRETTDDGVVLEVDGKARDVAWADLGAGRVQVEFNRTSAGEED